MSKKVMINRSQKYLFKNDLDVQKLLSDNRKVVEQFHDQVKRLQSADTTKDRPKLMQKQIVQKRKEKLEELKPKAAYFQQDTLGLSMKKNFNMLLAERLSASHDYWQGSNTPASCVGFAMTYSPTSNRAYIYGGISCNNSLENGLKNYFYEFDVDKRKWSQLQPRPVYQPTTRYGHSLNAHNKQLILFGGVSEFKAKLKDRCYYSDISVYDIPKNEWRMLETFSSDIRPRRNHAACLYQSFFVVYGGQNTAEDIIGEILVLNLQSKKPRWRTFQAPARVNHQLIYFPNLSGGNKEYLYSFGGLKQKKNLAEEEISNDIVLFPILFEDNHLVLRDSSICQTNFLPRDSCIFCRFDEGILIMGGFNERKEPIKDSQYLSVHNLTLKPIKIDINWEQLKQPQGVTVGNEQVLVFGGNHHTYLIQK